MRWFSKLSIVCDSPSSSGNKRLSSRSRSTSADIDPTMATNSKPVPSVIRPGKTPEGPPGWEERRVEKQVQAEQAQEKRNHRRENSTGMAGIKEKVHKIGEKMHLVEPKDPSQRSAAQLQDASTMPEQAPIEQ
ncbi:Fungal specific transcription factor domain protein [Pseudozyma hubeiensis]|nr:Fungal specific transcription factor domain protein [Pseudozyma hubeiensis]